MTTNNNWKMDINDEYQQEEPSSRHLLFALEDLLERSHKQQSLILSKRKYQSKSADDLCVRGRHGTRVDQNNSSGTLIELDLSGVSAENNLYYDYSVQRSRSAPISAADIYDKELAAFIQCDQQEKQSAADNFVYNIDLSDVNEETSRQLNSKIAVFFEEDFSSDEINYEPSSPYYLHSSLIPNCLTITEENEDEMDQDEEIQLIQTIPRSNIILLDDDNDTILYENDQQIEEKTDLPLLNMNKREDSIERLSTIYESPSPQPDVDEETEDENEKLIVYDMAKSSDSLISAPKTHRSSVTSNSTRPLSCYTEASLETCTNANETLSASRLCGTTTTINAKVYTSLSLSPVTDTEIIPSAISLPQPTISSRRSSQHIQTMRVIQSSSSSLSDFISTPSTLQDTIYSNNKTSNVHHSLSECSLLHQPTVTNNEIDLNTTDERKTSLSRRILTNGLLLLPTTRRFHEPLTVKFENEDKFLSDTSSSSELLSSSDEKPLSRSEYLLRKDEQTSQQRKASSLKSILVTPSQATSNILYPIDFDTHQRRISWQQKRSSDPYRMPIFDSGIIIDVRPTSISSIDEDVNHGTININQLQQYEIDYEKTLTDMTFIKKNIVDVESRLNEVTRELEFEQALIEGEHELVFKQILDASDSDQQKLRQQHINLQVLVERIMAEKTSIRNQISYTQQVLFKLERELRDLEEQYRSPDDTVLQKKENLSFTRKKYEELEFQLMELETRCESELEQAEEQFRNEQKLVTQNAKMRQNTLRELDHQQYLALHQTTLEKEKLEREKQKLKLFYKQKKIEANEYERKIQETRSNGHSLPRNFYQSTPFDLYKYRDDLSSPKLRKTGDQQDKINEMIVKIKLEEITNLEQQIRERYHNNLKRLEVEQKLADDKHVKLREKSRTQERPLTRYLPVRSVDFDLRAHIEGAGHLLTSSQITLTSATCRGYLYKMGGMKFKTWNRRWFVFDRQRRSLSYYLDKNELKLRGSIDFQSIVEVYIDQLQSISLRSPEPREATFIMKTMQRPYYLVAPTVELMRIWIDVIITGAEGNTFANV
ncbi:unnamed protein product [Adineta ricciae]|uniref:PH domain-containing protein n=1 Tax=Adineta ricciae TaxID=249248 RepID=A0A814LNW0_ADIRI|nr:unnamed protein product [Adineta ricciae]CAF1092156.1 unnamed protein product [Adineta ricciae]